MNMNNKAGDQPVAPTNNCIYAGNITSGHKYLHNSSFRQGLPESTTARMQEVEQCLEQLPRNHGWQWQFELQRFGQLNQPFLAARDYLLSSFFLRTPSHPCVLDSGNPCRNDGDTASWMKEVKSRLEQRSRAITEEQL